LTEEGEGRKHMTHIYHPWQSGPTELIDHGLTHLHRPTDFDRRIAFLLFDVGVETLFKTYLTAPEKETGALGKYHERKAAAEGNFHELIQGVEKAGGSRLASFNLSHVHFYHDTRNKLYHDGVGITVPVSETQAYAKLAVDLLRTLLDVDLVAELNKPAIAAAEQAQKDALHHELELQVVAVKESRSRLEQNVRAAVEKIDPKLALPSFQKRFEEYWDKSLDERQSSLPYDLRPKSYEEALSSTAAFFMNDPNLIAAKKFVATEYDKIRFHFDKESLVNIAATSDGDLIQFYLLLLSGAIFGKTRPDWTAAYSNSDLYPQGDIEGLTEKIYDSEYERIIDIIEPDHTMIIASGMDHVSNLNSISETIKNWMAES
jgi:hypothetical protein